ncbi:hypothetical protein BKA69DRAFT_1176538 [Paraphysoderma sedebokerense]|nr:hypothetical protein BKA69DRAFT_1176538 [Paraphysoderma sedebokerense]
MTKLVITTLLVLFSAAIIGVSANCNCPSGVQPLLAVANDLCLCGAEAERVLQCAKSVAPVMSRGWRNNKKPHIIFTPAPGWPTSLSTEEGNKIARDCASKNKASPPSGNRNDKNGTKKEGGGGGGKAGGSQGGNGCGDLDGNPSGNPSGNPGGNLGRTASKIPGGSGNRTGMGNGKNNTGNGSGNTGSIKTSPGNCFCQDGKTWSVNGQCFCGAEYEKMQQCVRSIAPNYPFEPSKGGDPSNCPDPDQDQVGFDKCIESGMPKELKDKSEIEQKCASHVKGGK